MLSYSRHLRTLQEFKMHAPLAMSAGHLVLSIPHIVVGIVDHLFAKDVCSCITVSKEFRHLFMPSIWHSPPSLIRTASTVSARKSSPQRKVYSLNISTQSDLSHSSMARPEISLSSRTLPCLFLGALHPWEPPHPSTASRSMHFERHSQVSLCFMRSPRTNQIHATSVPTSTSSIL
ncbi:MAG: hypothetical protein BYD32DRAFT_1173 [Podila humilis]|nr:MAG: hypothetical protein BYD32DRAFT_1173 [Podila humilis]